MPGLPPAYRAIILDQQDQLQRLVRTAGVAPVRALYDRMLADVTRRIDATPAATFGHQQLTGLLAQIKLGLARVQGAMGAAVEDSATQVGVHAARTLLTDAAKLEKHFTGAVISLPLLEIGRLNGLVADQIPSLMRAHNVSMARFGTQLVGRFEGEIGAAMALGESPGKMIDRLQTVGEMEWWRAERVVRTELNFAAGRSARAAADEQAEELDGDMWSRWTEHVTDQGTPLDDRVGVDSEAMHGQVAPPGEAFTQPPANRQGDLVSDSLVGRTWTCPPNRPNDRAVLVPWRAHWGVPGWRWEDGTRVPVTETAAARTNQAWRRSRGQPADIDSGDEEASAPVGPGFVSPTLAPAAEDLETEAAGVGAAPPEEPTAAGFASPILPARPEEISTEIPTHGDLSQADQKIPAADPQAIADHGWHEPPGYAADLERAARAYEEVADGLETPVKIGVTPNDNLVVHSSADAARINAAVDMDQPIPVHWQQTHGVPHGHVPKAGEDGGDPGFRIGVHTISGAAEGIEDVAPMPTTRLSGRAGAVEVAAAERRAAAALAGDDEREWATRIADAKARAASVPRGTTSLWRPGDELRRKESEIVQLAKPKPTETFYERDVRLARERQEREQRQRDRVLAAKPVEAPRGYDVVEEFPGIKTFVSQRTGRRYTEMDVRRGTLDPAGTPELGGPTSARVVKPGAFDRIGRGLRALGRRLAGR